MSGGDWSEHEPSAWYEHEVDEADYPRPTRQQSQPTPSQPQHVHHQSHQHHHQHHSQHTREPQHQYPARHQSQSVRGERDPRDRGLGDRDSRDSRDSHGHPRDHRDRDRDHRERERDHRERERERDRERERERERQRDLDRERELAQQQQFDEPDAAASSEDEDDDCPLCMEKLDATDKQFKPCQCGYQVCLWCFHHINENLGGKCPACRRTYDTTGQMAADPAVLETIAAKASSGGVRRGRDSNANKGNSTRGNNNNDDAARSRDSDRRKVSNAGAVPLAHVRVLQRNLLYVIGLPVQLAKDELLRSRPYFGKFGRIIKLKIALGLRGGGDRKQTCSCYVTYKRGVDAVEAIRAVNGSIILGCLLKATYGTSKYCANWLRGSPCNNPSCLYLHETADPRDSTTKDELSAFLQETQPSTVHPQAISVNGLPGATSNSSMLGSAAMAPLVPMSRTNSLGTSQVPDRDDDDYNDKPSTAPAISAPPSSWASLAGSGSRTAESTKQPGQAIHAPVEPTPSAEVLMPNEIIYITPPHLRASTGGAQPQRKLGSRSSSNASSAATPQGSTDHKYEADSYKDEPEVDSSATTSPYVSPTASLNNLSDSASSLSVLPPVAATPPPLVPVMAPSPISSLGVVGSRPPPGFFGAKPVTMPSIAPPAISQLQAPPGGSKLLTPMNPTFTPMQSMQSMQHQQQQQQPPPQLQHQHPPQQQQQQPPPAASQPPLHLPISGLAGMSDDALRSLAAAFPALKQHPDILSHVMSSAAQRSTAGVNAQPLGSRALQSHSNSPSNANGNSTLKHTLVTAHPSFAPTESNSLVDYRSGPSSLGPSSLTQSRQTSSESPPFYQSSMHSAFGSTITPNGGLQQLAAFPTSVQQSTGQYGHGQLSPPRHQQSHQQQPQPQSQLSSQSLHLNSHDRIVDHSAPRGAPGFPQPHRVHNDWSNDEDRVVISSGGRLTANSNTSLDRWGDWNKQLSDADQLKQQQEQIQRQDQQLRDLQHQQLRLQQQQQQQQQQQAQQQLYRERERDPSELWGNSHHPSTNNGWQAPQQSQQLDGPSLNLNSSLHPAPAPTASTSRYRFVEDHDEDRTLAVSSSALNSSIMRTFAPPSQSSLSAQHLWSTKPSHSAGPPGIAGLNASNGWQTHSHGDAVFAPLSREPTPSQSQSQRGGPAAAWPTEVDEYAAGFSNSFGSSLRGFSSFAAGPSVQSNQSNVPRARAPPLSHGDRQVVLPHDHYMQP